MSLADLVAPYLVTEYGRVGRFKDGTDDFTFMVLNLNALPGQNYIYDCIILAGRTSFITEWRGPGDIGPVSVEDPRITWL
jgi:hypothetical protein